MTKPNTLQDLHAQGLVTNRDLEYIARRFFMDIKENTIIGVVEGYDVRPPNFDDLPDSCKQFIRKALLFSTVINILDTDKPEEISPLESLDDADLPVMDEKAHYAVFGSDGDA